MEASINNFKWIGLLGFLVVLLCSVCPLLASCQTTEKGNKPAKIAAPSRSTKQVKQKPIKLLPIIEVASTTSASRIKQRADSYPPVYENELGQLMNGYFRIRYYSEPTSHGSDNMIYVEGIGHYVNGLRQGEWTTHYIIPEQGLNYTEMYRGGLEHGPLIVYKPDKQVLYQTTFEQGNGMWKSFYPDTKLEREGAYKGGRRQGMWRYYDKQGQLTKEELFENGELVPAK